MSNNPNNNNQNTTRVKPITLKNPLTPQQLEDLKVVSNNIKVAQKHLDLAKKAGLDVTIQQQDLDNAKKQVEGLLAVYGNPINFS